METGRSGVGNKITVFDVSSRAADLEPSAEIDLSRDEDSVTSLANLATKDGLILFAGINSSESDCLANKNQHFRSFEVTYPKKRKNPDKDLGQSANKPAIRFLHKTTLFSPLTSEVARREAYQGLLRLSPSATRATSASSGPTKRIGAIATRFGRDENEIVVFNATVADPKAPDDVIQRVTPPKGAEAHDIDIIQPDGSPFQLVYCTDSDVFVLAVDYDFSKKRLQGGGLKSAAPPPPEKKFTMPYPDVFEKKGRPKIRFCRWLSPFHILLLVNLPNKTGVELQVLRLYGDTMGSIILRKRLPSNIKAAVDMDVCLLDSDDKGAYQIVVAVAGNDVSTTILTVDYYGTGPNTLGRFHQYTQFRDVHPQGITKLVFSPFKTPQHSDKNSTPPGPQYLRLASTSYGNTVVVDAFTLVPASSSNPRSRYILSSARSRLMYKSASYFVAAFVLLVLLLLTQSLFDPEGHLTKGYVPTRVRNTLTSYRQANARMNQYKLSKSGSGLVTEGDDDAPVVRTTHRLHDLIQRHLPVGGGSSPRKNAIIVQRDPDTGSLATEVHSGGEEALKGQTDARRWEELSQAEQHHWKESLVQAGAWAVDEGETVLKGIFFGQVGGLIGEMAQGVLNG